MPGPPLEPDAILQVKLGKPGIISWPAIARKNPRGTIKADVPYVTEIKAEISER